MLLKAKNLGLSWMGFQPFEFRGALIKYLGNDSDVVDQARNFEAMGINREAKRGVHIAENYKNREREIHFMNQVAFLVHCNYYSFSWITHISPRF